MKIKNFKNYILCLIICLPLIAAISIVQKNINDIREQEKLTNTDIVDNAPPAVAFFTVVLGSFRGLLADILWLRSTELQNQGKYYEMVQLASWITKLQPKFSGGTAFLAWNMAFNISVTCSSYEDRWRWVRKGIELIRDEALLYNPGDPMLYKELGWIYQFKIGNMLDDAHQHYKNRMAVELMGVFGKAEPDWEALEAAPKTEAELLEMLKLGDDFWKGLLKSEKPSKTAYSNMQELEKDFRLFGELPEKVKDALKQNEKAIAILDNYLRAKWIKEKYKLDPEVVMEINRKYGKLDWRLPEAHAIYWATLGIKNDAKGEYNVQCERMITQSLKDALMGGKLLMAEKDNPETYLCMPNFEVADAVVEASQEAYERHKTKTFKSGMINFMTDIVVMMYTFGKYKQANKFLKMLQEEEPNNLKYRVGLDNFAMKEWQEDIKDATVKQAKAIIGSMLFRAYYFLASGEEDSADAHMRLAEGLFNIYREENKTNRSRGFDFDKLKEAQKNNVKRNLQLLKEYGERKNRFFKTPEELKKEEEKKKKLRPKIGLMKMEQRILCRK